MAECRSCNAEIIWAVTESGARTPVDAEYSPSGTIELRYGRPGEPPTAVTLRREEISRARPLHTSHFATCPNADRHRRARSHRDTRR